MANAKTYRSKKPCFNGHQRPLRYVSSRACVECTRLRTKPEPADSEPHPLYGQSASLRIQLPASPDNDAIVGALRELLPPGATVRVRKGLSPSVRTEYGAKRWGGVWRIYARRVYEDGHALTRLMPGDFGSEAAAVAAAERYVP